ncbi:MAG TPA: multidrug efflux RND transporter permease subunit [Candidatus Binatia bacterium]|jgi:HAE1 family hydrophobic/amphiphilic exporter-1|nr:multidrug efflux RND transporter permease subunit [Candidatus Binatia bacterium]
MARFFVNRPIVAMVLSIIMVIVGVVSLVQLPVAQYPNIAPPEIQITANYVGADALTVEESVATPIEQNMSGVDQMIYMYSVNASNGQMQLRVDFDITTVPNIDQVLAYLRFSQAQSNLPEAVRNYGVTILKSTTSPLALFSIYSPNGTYDAEFLSNYGYININDPMTRVPGVGQVQIFGAGQYAMRYWVRPDQLAKLNITTNEIILALQQQNVVNPAGQVGGEPIPEGQQFTYSVRAKGRLVTEEQFGDIIVRSNPDGSIVRMKDVARVELGSQMYNMVGRLNGKPAAIVAIYQLPGSNAIDTMNQATALMEDAKTRFPQDLDYVISLDTTLAVREGINEIVHTLLEAVVLVLLVVFLFLQSWRATLIPLLAVPVALIGTFCLFPLFGFSVNTLSLLGLVLAIGLVVDDAIVVVEAVEHHIEEGMTPRDATLKAMDEVSAPVIAIALILCAVFVPTAAIPGITGLLYQQFAVTIAVSVALSAFNALTLSPALCSILLRPKKKSEGLLGRFFAGFNRMFDRATGHYVTGSEHLIRKSGRAMLSLLVMAVLAGFFGSRLPGGFVPEEDQGYFYMNVQLPAASSLQRTDATARIIEGILAKTPGVQSYNTILGFSLLSQASTTYNAFYFVTLTPWGERDVHGLTADVIQQRLNAELAGLPEAMAFAFSPPSIPGVGTAGGVTFMLQDRSGGTVEYLAQQTNAFMAAARKRPELTRVSTTFIPNTPQIYADVDAEKVLKQSLELKSVYQTLQAFMGGVFVNYFNRFGRVWQVYVQAEGEYRTRAENVGQFYVRNTKGDAVPMSSVVRMEPTFGPEFTMRFNGSRAAQLNVTAAPGVSSGKAMEVLEDVFRETMPKEMGFAYSGMSFQEQAAAQGVPASVIFGLSLLFVFLILAAQYESWTLPFSVLLGTPIAVFGAFLALWLRGLENNVFAQIGLITLIGLGAKNAILIVEFAKDEYEKGKPIMEAALTAARLRLRPILMTAFAFALGVLPLATAAGAGAKGRQILGTAVIGGTLMSSLIAIFLVPVSFYVVERLGNRGGKPHAPPPPATDGEHVP